MDNQTTTVSTGPASRLSEGSLLLNNALELNWFSPPIADFLGLVGDNIGGQLKTLGHLSEFEEKIRMVLEKSMRYESSWTNPQGHQGILTFFPASSQFTGMEGVLVSLSPDTSIQPVLEKGSNNDVSLPSQGIATQHKFIQKVLSIVPSVIYVFNQQTMSNEYSNKEIAATLGYTESEIKEMGAGLFPTLCHPDDLGMVGENFAKIMALKEGETSSVEYRMLNKNGVYRWLLSIDTVFERNDSQGVIKHIGVATDISELKEIQSQLTKVNEELEQFTYIATHDLKTPIINLESILMMIKGLPDMVDNDKLGLIPIMDKAILQAKSVLNNLLQVAKTGLMADGKTQDIELKPVLEDILDMMHFTIESTETKITMDFSLAPKLQYSLPHLESILHNLLGNAITYRHPERVPEIHFSSKITEDWVCISVSDNGLGIDLKKDRQRLFGLYKRIHHVGKGSGMGLYMTKKILEANGGKIEVESELQKGSTFRVYLKTNNNTLPA